MLPEVGLPRKDVRKRPLPRCPAKPRKCDNMSYLPKLELTKQLLPDIEESALIYNPENVSDLPPSYIKVGKNLSTTLVYKSNRNNTLYKTNFETPTFTNPILQEIKVKEDIKSDGKTKPMTLKFSFWHKQAKTHSLNDKETDLRNQEVIARAQKDFYVSKELTSPRKLANIDSFDPNVLNDKRHMCLKTNFWSKASTTVFLNSNVGRSAYETKPYTTKNFTAPRNQPKVFSDHEEPMKLKSQFRCKDAKTVFLGKVV